MADFPIDTDAIRTRIKQMMDEMGVNAATFADDAGITRSVISNILNQKSGATLDTVNKLLLAYPSWGKSWLIFGEGAPHPSGKQLLTLQSEPGLFQSEPLSGFPDSPPSSKTSPPIISREEVSVLIEETVKVLSSSTNSAERCVAEIRVFYSDGSFEVFKKA